MDTQFIVVYKTIKQTENGPEKYINLIYYLNIQFLQKCYKIHKETAKYSPSSGRKKSIETDSEWAQMLELAKKNLKKDTLNMLKN